MKEPLATISSAAFALVAAWIGPAAPLLSATLCVLSVASAAFHASNSERNTWAHRLDEWAVYAAALALAAHVWAFGWIGMAGAGLLMAAGALKLRRLDSFRVLPLLMTVIAAGIAYRVGVVEALVAVLGVLPALVVRGFLPQTDINHAGWHALIAFAVGWAWWLTL